MWKFDSNKQNETPLFILILLTKALTNVGEYFMTESSEFYDSIPFKSSTHSPTIVTINNFKNKNT
jgi:hypothetical protein